MPDPEINPFDCDQCRRDELGNVPLGTVAKHWVLNHPSYLEVVKAAVAIYQAQDFGITARV